MESTLSKYKASILFYIKIIVLCSKELKISDICSASKDMNLEKRSKTNWFLSNSCPEELGSLAQREGFSQPTPEYLNVGTIWAWVM